MKTLLAVLALSCLSVLNAGAYSLRDEGGFEPTGQRVEFADRYGWDAYRVDFDFGLDAAGRALTDKSKLTLKIVKKDGSAWEYACRAKGKRPLAANINFVHGKGISVVVECRIAENEFAQAVGLDKEDVGSPSLVFHAIVQDGKVLPGAQKGLYFLPSGQIESSELNAYASSEGDPSNLAVYFRSN